MNTRNVKSENSCRSVETHSALFGLNPIIIEILHSRGIDTPGAIDSFLKPRLADMHSPFLLSGMYQAVDRFRKAIEGKEHIGIFADSDLDGITSLAVIYQLLGRMKITPFLRYLKDDENYGMTAMMIDEFRNNGVTLIITVDSGTRDVAEIAYARSLGIDVIVTDHHEQDLELPDAIVVNPRITGSGYPFGSLAGVGVAFKLCHALLMSYLPSFNKLFYIVTQDPDGYSFSVIRNGIIEGMEIGCTREQVEQHVDTIDDNDSILLPDDSLSPGMKELFIGKKIIPFIEFVNRILKAGEESLAGICNAIGLATDIYDNGIATLNKIFLEMQLAGSDKITDFIDSVIGLVSIGTIADVVPLIGENRVLVKNGIATLARVKHMALSALVNNETISSRSIGWTIAPLLNTPGRLGKTDLTVKFFIENDARALRSIIDEIKTLNESRRTFINDFCLKTMDQINNGELESSGYLIYIKTYDIPDGYAGLIANRIADSTGKPVIVAAFPGKNGLIKGSGRSRSGMKFFSLIDGISEQFERIGGHENAFGFTASATLIDQIIHSIEKTLRESDEHAAPLLPERELDMEIIDVAFINELYRLEPFGSGNSEPVFISRRAQFDSFLMFGKEHGKYSLSKLNPLAAIGWGKGAIMKKYFEEGRPFDVVYRLENNRYNGSISPRMILLDMKFSDE